MAQPPVQLIKLQPAGPAINTFKYHIAKVVSAGKASATGNLIETGIDKKPSTLKVQIDGGSFVLEKFMKASVESADKATPVIVQIKTLKVTEALLPNGRINGSLSTAIEFSLQKPDTILYLTDYKATSAYQRNAGNAKQIEPLLATTLRNSMVYLDNWINANADNNIKLAKAVKSTFKYHSEQPEGDTIYYDANRPLKWQDFQAPQPRYSKFGAEIFASLGYAEQTKLSKGIIEVEIDLKVYMPKSASWVLERSSYGLNHEQRHYDIVRLVAEHFRKKIEETALPVDNYDGPINVAYFDALYELDKLQKQYDAETEHGINRYQQEIWNKKISDELYKLGIKQSQELSSL
ncbi:hypothetical protein FPZ43_10405 [Mucilaginibacter pallidiroseus]|uniref:DUF922 domain-containing protein n=1 Tax=Mucilaginibacter pallidiroseus TaxID=2599295 RepID=A0A563UDC8_9SPHI|nr:hypothetical protein [Mucilaginibacter pallidiroseus]TWR29358.1 hypothetical protein FPZ43_10405 [Mucilaginibacter pallidiroseus]